MFMQIQFNGEARKPIPGKAPKTPPKPPTQAELMTMAARGLEFLRLDLAGGSLKSKVQRGHLIAISAALSRYERELSKCEKQRDESKDLALGLESLFRKALVHLNHALAESRDPRKVAEARDWFASCMQIITDPSNPYRKSK